MRVKKISAFVLAVMLVLSPFTLFSFASDSLSLKDSGSPEVSMMAMRSMAANDGISLAAAEGNSGQFGYNIEPFDDYVNQGLLDTGSSYQYLIDAYLIPGTYSFSLSSTSNIYNLVVYDRSTSSNLALVPIRTSNSGSIIFEVEHPGSYGIFASYTYSSIPDPNAFSVYNFDISALYPVEGISSGYTFNSGVKDDDDVSARLSYVDWAFGNQPAGNYLINIYTYGQNYDVNFDISVGDVTSERKLAVAKSNGLYTCLVSHGGGDLTLTANFTYFKDSLNSPAGGYSSNIYYVSSGNWVFNIVDVVAVPLDSAGLEQFGIFGSVVGFLRNEYSSLKSFLSVQLEKISGDSETKATVDSAASELQQEVNDLNTLHGQLDSQASTLEQQFSNDFAVPSEVAGQTANLQLMYSGIFSSLGVFSIFVWLPVVLAVIKKLLRL